MQNQIVPYKTAKPQLDTFTLINCIHHKFPYNLIGHSAILWKCEATGQLMIFESTTLNKFSMQSGVQLHAFGGWLKRYPGKVFARIPTFHDHADGIDHNYRRRRLAEAFIQNYLGTSYPDLKTWAGKLKLAFSALDFKIFGIDIFQYKSDDIGIFCTMLVILLLQYCELFDTCMEAKEFEPDDLRGNKQDFEENVCIFTDYADEIQLK